MSEGAGAVCSVGTRGRLMVQAQENIPSHNARCKKMLQNGALS